MKNHIIAELYIFYIVELARTYKFGYNPHCMLITLPCRKFFDASGKTKAYYSWKPSLFQTIILTFIINVPENKCSRYKMYFIWCLMFFRMLWILLQTLYSLYVNVCICSISHGFANHAVPLLRYKWLKCRALRKTSQRLLHLLDGIPISDVTLLKRHKTPATG